MLNLTVSITIQNSTFSVLPGKTLANNLYSLAGIDKNEYQILLDIPDEIDIPIEENDILLIRGNEKFIVSHRDHGIPNNPELRTPIQYHLNGDAHTSLKAKIELSDLDAINGNGTSEQKFIVDLDNLADIILPHDTPVLLGNEWRILSIPISTNKEPVDIFDCSKSQKDPGLACSYKIKINDQKHIVEVPHLLGSELFELAGIENSAQHTLYQKTKGQGTVRIDLNDKVDLTRPGIERFITIPLDMTEGFEERRDFQMPDDDTQFLQSLDLPWEAVCESNVRRIVVHNFPIPDGYNTTEVSLNVRIEASYPETQIDMVYFHPALARNDGKPIKAIASDQFDSKCWQRWSRHRTSQNPWRPGIDNLSTHLAAVTCWLQQELTK